MKNFSQLSVFVILVALAPNIFANCFTASGKAMGDGQTIRKVADSMGWKVGKMASITAGNFIKSKSALYPQGNIEVCLKDNFSGELKFKAQSSSSDAGVAEWRGLPGKKK